MKNLKKALALCLSLLMIMAFPVAASADEIDFSVIAPDATGSITLYTYDLTNAMEDGVWNNSYVSSGVFDESVTDALSGGANNYAISGVEFSYMKVADIVQDQGEEVGILYAVDKTTGADFLKAIGLTDGKDRYTAADGVDATKYFYRSDVLGDALAAALAANTTSTKNALENYIAGSGTAMAETDEYGMTMAEDLPVGLYLVVETKFGPSSNITATCNPFLVSLPMSRVSGTNNTDGGTGWLYDIVAYPKNKTGEPSLEKTVREVPNVTGRAQDPNPEVFADFSHTATASAGDTVQYQIRAELPVITSQATYLSRLEFLDTLASGLSYNKQDVTIEFYSDYACYDQITTWTEADGKFTVSYGTPKASGAASTMTIQLTETGLAEINTAKTVYTSEDSANSGYSGCTIRITYGATLHSDDSLVTGDAGNPNQVTMRWARSDEDDFATAQDDAHIYSYGLELTKLFSDGQGNFSNVEFILFNDTDSYYIVAELDEESGIYYMVGHTTAKNEATRFVPVANEKSEGIILIQGLENDTYIAKELKTDDAYNLLKNDIEITIQSKASADNCTADNASGEHKLLTASAKVNGSAVNMKASGESQNAVAPLKVMNTKGFDLPETGDRGVWMYGLVGILLMAGSVACIILTNRKKSAR